MTTLVTRSQPVPRQQVYDLYWYFASERQRIFERRVFGEPPPWTDDPILQKFKFCNVFRAADRVSQYMVRQVCYHDEPCHCFADRLFQIIAFRTFSDPKTWEGLRSRLGTYPRLDDLRSGTFREALDDIKAQHSSIYTSAFILCANSAYGQPFKHLNHVELFKHMFLREQIAYRLIEAPSLQAVYDILRKFPLMGDFMSYQTAIDLNYSDLVNFSENDFTQPGPGALRGIKKCFTSTGDFTPAQVIHWMVGRQNDEFERLGLPWEGLFGRPLQAIDCQGLFCEIDKYCREALPELASVRKRIKTRFKPTPEPLSLFFPPKWGINSRLPSTCTPPSIVPCQPSLF